jgi:DNA-binding response OmpR family regulator
MAFIKKGAAMVNILVVEDDRTLLKVMCAFLEKKGYRALPAGNGAEALALMEREHIDLMVTDIMMPGADGFALTGEVRGAGCTFPILMVTARERFEDKERGFGAGADDYMVKPIDVNEMALRVEALLRRAKISAERSLSFGRTRLEYDMLCVIGERETVELPQKEFLLLFKLLSYPGRIFTRQALMEEIWGLDSDSEERTVDVHISRLRDKFYRSEDFEIVTVRGLGYKALIKARGAGTANVL